MRTICGPLLSLAAICCREPDLRHLCFGSAVPSFSSFILERFSSLIETHLIVTFFLTMLVGAGGNAGNQSAVMVIRGLATGIFASMLILAPSRTLTPTRYLHLGTVRDDNQYKILWRQLVTGLIMSVILVSRNLI